MLGYRRLDVAVLFESHSHPAHDSEMLPDADELVPVSDGFIRLPRDEPSAAAFSTFPRLPYVRWSFVVRRRQPTWSPSAISHGT